MILRADAPFISMMIAALVLIGAVMVQNISPAPVTVNAAATTTADDTKRSDALRQGFLAQGLSLHDGKYWKTTHE